jgi:4a-hydroxytetrahydrobiopterin dehydratase
MSLRDPLRTDKIDAALEELPGWKFESDALTKAFEFSNFREAMSFLIRVAFEAEQLEHHPEIENVYNRVRLTLRTHDAGNRVTGLDVSLAQAIQHFAWR